MIEQEIAYYLLQALKENRLVVAKIKGLRQAISENPKWYRELCSCHVKTRKRYPRLRTIIKRCHVLRTLKMIVDGNNKDTIYRGRIQDFLEERWIMP